MTFHGDVSVGHLTLSGYYNGTLVNNRLADAIRLDEDDVHILGRKIFTNTVAFQDLNVGSLNGHPFDHVLKHLVLTDVPTSLPEHMTIVGRVSTPVLQARSLVVEVSKNIEPLPPLTHIIKRKPNM